MIDLKRPAVRSDESNAPTREPATIEKAHYPYGLRLHLEKEELEKLGDQVADMAKGDRFYIKALVEVCSLSVNEDEYGESASMGWQIQQMEVGAPAAGGKTTVRDALNTLRGNAS